MSPPDKPITVPRVTDPTPVEDIAPILLSSSIFGVACLLLGSLVAFVALFDIVVLESNVNVAATSGRMVIAVLLIAAGGLATTGRLKVGFVLYALTQTFALLNAHAVAGFGVYAPAFFIAILTPILAVAMFGFREGVRLSAVVVLAWGLTALSHLYDIYTQTVTGTLNAEAGNYYGASAIPTPTAWLLSLFAVVAVVIAVITAYEKQARAMLAYERRRSVEMESLLNERAQHSLERERFMAQLSQELQGPLHKLQRALKLARSRNQDVAAREQSFEEMKAAATQLQGLLGDALDSFSVAQGDVELDMVEFAISDFLQEIEQQFSGAAQLKGLRFVTQTNVLDSHRLLADRARLNQMLAKFISNAIRFTEHGSIAVRVLQQTHQPGLWRFEVCDTGPGIELEDQQKLFKPFGKIESASPALAAPGFAIGLNVVSQMSEALGGRAGLYSESGLGSVFYFEVPLKSVTRLPALSRDAQLLDARA